MKAVFNNTTLAESDKTIVVEGNHYFPPESVNLQYFKNSALTTVCPWKGTASYYTIEVNGESSANAAWYYPDTKDAAKNIEHYIAFYPIVKLTK